MARAALIGANGQLGSDIVRLWSGSRLGPNDELVALTHADVDVTDRNMVRSVLNGVRPTLVINTAAYHRVDECESEPQKAFEVNGLGVKYLAEVCKELSAVLMHFSTDYVFNGKQEKPYGEADPVSPVSAYGISKAAGEHFLRYVLPERHILIRSSGLYGAAGASGKGGNFVDTMVRFAREGRPIRVVQDQVTAPTYTMDLASTLIDVIAEGGRGTFHITNAGQASWYDFAAEIFRLLDMEPDLLPTTTDEYAAKAHRPAYSVLENSHLGEMGIARPRAWQEALADYMRLKGLLPA